MRRRSCARPRDSRPVPRASGRASPAAARHRRVQRISGRSPPGGNSSATPAEVPAARVATSTPSGRGSRPASPAVRHGARTAAGRSPSHARRVRRVHIDQHVAHRVRRLRRIDPVESQMVSAMEIERACVAECLVDRTAPAGHRHGHDARMAPATRCRAFRTDAGRVPATARARTRPSTRSRPVAPAPAAAVGPCVTGRGGGIARHRGPLGVPDPVAAVPRGRPARQAAPRLRCDQGFPAGSR